MEETPRELIVLAKGNPTARTGKTLSDRELMAGVREGDPAVLRILLGRYLLPLRRYAEVLCAGDSDGEEAVQEAFVRLWEKRESWRADGSVKALLYILTRNAAIDSLRRRRRESPLDDARLACLPSPAASPYDQIQEAELTSLVDSAVSRLPKRRQEVFRLVREAGLSYREVAETLEISPQTVANLMSLALADLRSSLGPLLDTEPSTSARGRTGPDAKEASGSN